MSDTIQRGGNVAWLLRFARPATARLATSIAARLVGSEFDLSPCRSDALHGWLVPVRWVCVSVTLRRASHTSCLGQ